MYMYIHVRIYLVYNIRIIIHVHVRTCQKTLHIVKTVTQQYHLDEKTPRLLCYDGITLCTYILYTPTKKSYIRTCTYMYVHIHVHVHVHVRTYKHSHTLAYIHSLLRSYKYKSTIICVVLILVSDSV